MAEIPVRDEEFLELVELGGGSGEGVMGVGESITPGSLDKTLPFPTFSTPTHPSPTHTWMESLIELKAIIAKYSHTNETDFLSERDLLECKRTSIMKIKNAHKRAAMYMVNVKERYTT
jgi:hypothetical protein